MNPSEVEALLEKAATQFMLGENAETVATLALLSRAAVAPEALQLVGELHQVASQNVSGNNEWMDEASRAHMEQGLDQLRRILSAGGAAESVAPSEAAPPAASSALNQDPELVGDFILEAREHLQTVESGLLVLEKEPANPEILNAVFRSFHTIKGLAGFLEFGNIQALAHEVETILDLARTGQLTMTPNLTDLTLESADYVGKEVNRIEAQLHAQDPGPVLDPSHLLVRVRAVIAGDHSAPPQQSMPEAAPEPTVIAPAAIAETPVQ